MATHYENAADHLVSAMTSEPGSDTAVFHTCAALMFSYAAENYPDTSKES